MPASATNAIERKYVGGHVLADREIKEVTNAQGIKVGRVEGHLAAFSQEHVPFPDRFVKGAFLDSIQEHKDRDDRQIRLNFMHRRDPIGGMPIKFVHEDNFGLFVVAEISLETQRGRETYALAKQRVIVDFSIGYQVQVWHFEEVNGEEVRVISKARILEGSLVDEPLNRDAQVSAVKASNPYHNLPVGTASLSWEANEANERVLDMRARDGDADTAFLGEGRKFQIADFRDGKLLVVPDAVKAAAAEIKALEEPDPELIRHVTRYLDRCSLPNPFDKKEAGYFQLDDVRSWTARDCEKFLIGTGQLSKGAAKYLIANDPAEPEGKRVGLDDILAVLEDIPRSA